jgi:hypothetical protein
MTTENAIDSATLSGKITSLMPDCDDRRMWRNLQARALEVMSEADDPTLIRAGQKADEYSALSQASAGGHLVQVTTNPNHAFLGRFLRLAELDQDTRKGIFNACATELRKP